MMSRPKLCLVTLWHLEVEASHSQTLWHSDRMETYISANPRLPLIVPYSDTTEQPERLSMSSYHRAAVPCNQQPGLPLDQIRIYTWRILAGTPAVSVMLSDLTGRPVHSWVCSPRDMAW